jgi:hypothetical protein
MSDQTEMDQGGKWWTSPRFVVSAVVVALLAAVGLALALWPGDGPAASLSPVTAPPASSLPAGSGSVCGLDATGGRTLTRAPKVAWAPIGATDAPSSAEHGPGRIDGTTRVRSCYSHTPEGALLAAVNLLASSADPELLLETTRQQTVDSPGKKVALAQIQQRIEDGGPGIPMEVAGFRLLSYSQEEATVEVVMSFDDGENLTHVTTGADLVWQGGDWKFVLADDGTGGPVSGKVSDLSRYVLWSSNG